MLIRMIVIQICDVEWKESEKMMIIQRLLEQGSGNIATKQNIIVIQCFVGKTGREMNDQTMALI